MYVRPTEMTPMSDDPNRGLSLLRRNVLFFCFFMSGSTSLVLETAWSKQLSYLLGVDLFGAATTVAAYMSGLGLGAFFAFKYSRRFLSQPLRIYAWLQILIGVAGLLTIPLLRATTPLFSALYQLNQNQVLFVALRFLVTFSLLLPATTLMGMTLPVVIGAERSSLTQGARVAGFLYGINTLGAVAGAICAGFIFIPMWGLLKTCLIAGLIDLAIAGLVWLLLLRKNSEVIAVPPPSPQVGTNWKERSVLVALAISGVSALGLELSWFRLLAQVVGPSVSAFAITLAVFLAGIGLGSLMLAALMRWFVSGRVAFLFTLIWTVVGATIPAYYINEIPGWYLDIWKVWGLAGRDFDLIRTQSAIAAIVILPAALGLGASFPAAIWAMNEETGSKSSASSSAQLFFFNTVGALIGTLVWAFLVLPNLGAAGGIKIAAACSILAILIVRTTTRSEKLPHANLIYGVVVLIALVVYLAPAADPRIQNSGLFNAVRGPHAKGKVDVNPLRKEAQLLFHKEGYNASIAVIKNRHGRNAIDISYSGKWVASTHPSSLKHLVLLGHLPMLLVSPAPKRALVIGLGSGITSGSVLRYESLEHVDIVELEPAVIQGAAFFNKFSGDPVSDDRVRLLLQDGRTHVFFGKSRYDVITSDPIHPWVKGAANLYTREFYVKVRASLNARGVYCQWIPSSMSRESFVSITKTMSSVFGDVKLLFSGGEAIALASQSVVEFKTERLNEALKDSRVLKELQLYHLGKVDELTNFLSRNLRRVPEVKALIGTINTDDNVKLEHALPWDMFHGDRANARDFPLVNPVGTLSRSDRRITPSSAH